MRKLATILLPAALALSACGQTTSPSFDIQRPALFDKIQSGEVRAPEINIPPVQDWELPDPKELGRSFSENIQELQDGVWRQVEIAKMPKVQRVMMLKGSHLAETAEDRNQNFSRWNPNRTYEWTIMLEDSRLFTVKQSGPQFYRYESLMLVKKGLKLTLIHRPDSQDYTPVEPPEPYQAPGS